jgi:glycerol-3-phosphate dehydrogenase
LVSAILKKIANGSFLNMNKNLIEKFRENPNVDVLVIGGGVNGIGTFRDIALQGLNVLLVEKGDFCSGASAGSSHMLHGGIRYLENGEFRLVKEALHERNRLLLNAPHYAKPLPTTVPMFKWFSGLFNAPLKFLGLLDRPSERGGIVIKLGLMMYDLFTGSQQTMPYHQFRLKSASLKKLPKLNPDIVCTATYYDAYMPSPERLCMDMIRDVLDSCPNATAMNYAQLTTGDKKSVTIRDLASQQEFCVEPRIVINAAGPWIDFVNKAMGESTQIIGGTKGSHLMIDNSELYEATGGSEIFFESEDGRIVLIFPYMGKVMLGTTDIRIDDPEKAVCTEDEIEYMLHLVKRVYPSIKVERSQIVFTFSGVRPLPATKDNRTGAISRDHSIQSITNNPNFSYDIHSLVGGKWTTFRAFSEQTTDVVLKSLKSPRKVSTEDLPIGGGKDFPTDEASRQKWLNQLHAETELELTHLSMLLDRYGTYAKDVAKFMSTGNDAPLKTIPHYSQREIEFIVKHEMVQHVDDFMLRRSSLAILGYNSASIIEEIANVMGNTLGWSVSEISDEIKRTKEIFQKKHMLKYD